MEEEIKRQFSRMCSSQTDEAVRRSVYTKLAFHQKVLESKSPNKEYFQLCRSINGKGVKFTKTEKKSHLFHIVKSNELLFTDTTDAAEIRPIYVHYTK